MTSDPSSFFSPTFADARRRFLAAAERAGAGLRSYAHKATGLHGESLSTDTALIGSPSAHRVLVIESATHGVEGYCGSALQLALLEQGLLQLVPSTVAILLVHAINPYGFSWRRRGDHDNIDLNRNFVEFGDERALRNELFEKLAPHVLPRLWNEVALAAADEQLQRLAAEYGTQTVSRALRCGQHTHPGSLFYGGREPSESRRVVERIAAQQLAHAETVLILDIHTGLGAYGELELLSTAAAGSAEFERLHAGFGHRMRSTVDPNSGAANATGNIFVGYRRCLTNATVLGLAMEFGTYEQTRVQRALRADAWLHLQKQPDVPVSFAEDVREEMLEAFCPGDLQWREAVVRAGTQTFTTALKFLQDG